MHHQDKPCQLNGIERTEMKIINNPRPPRKRINKKIYDLILVGFLIGAVIGYIDRPTVPIVNKQLPFSVVITRGSTLRGADLFLKGYADKSFDRIIDDGLVGALIGLFVVITITSTNDKEDSNQA